jgi:hypothetical protein
MPGWLAEPTGSQPIPKFLGHRSSISESLEGRKDAEVRNESPHQRAANALRHCRLCTAQCHICIATTRLYQGGSAARASMSLQSGLPTSLAAMRTILDHQSAPCSIPLTTCVPQIFEEMGVDTDESIGADMKGLEALLPSKRRKF